MDFSKRLEIFYLATEYSVAKEWNESLMSLATEVSAAKVKILKTVIFSVATYLATHEMYS